MCVCACVILKIIYVGQETKNRTMREDEILRRGERMVMDTNDKQLERRTNWETMKQPVGSGQVGEGSGRGE